MCVCAHLRARLLTNLPSRSSVDASSLGLSLNCLYAAESRRYLFLFQ